jgi:hypothetical protein
MLLLFLPNKDSMKSSINSKAFASNDLSVPEAL